MLPDSSTLEIRVRRAAVTPLVSADGWTCRASSATGALYTASERVLFGDGVMHLAYRMTGANGWEIPLSYWQQEDTLTLHVNGLDYSIEDTVWIRKTNTPHFESPDCPTNMFHEISAVTSTHHFIDSITVIKASVDYAQIENIQLHLFGTP